ncbi:EamA family transporter [Bradyrhizobium manausense]
MGASNGSAFAALSPVMITLLAMPILGEQPATLDWIAMLLISGGVYIASGGALGLAVAILTMRKSAMISIGQKRRKCQNGL